MSAEKRKLCYKIVLLSLSVLLIISTLFVPLVHIVAYDSSKAVTYDKVVNLIQYFKDSPFVTTPADEVYFNATGPMWMAITGILANFFLLPTLLVLMCSSIYGIVVSKSQKLQKCDGFLRKIAIFAGYLSIFAFIFEFVSFLITTLMSNGYCVFESNLQPFVTVTFGIATLVFGYLTKAEQTLWQPNKTKNLVCYSLTLLFVILAILLMFMPQLSPILSGDFNSFYSTSYHVLDYGTWLIKCYGDIPIGLIRYATFALFIASAFVAIYCIIGIIRTAMRKPTNWLLLRVKRWSMAIFIVYSVIYFLVCATISVLLSTMFVFDETAVMPLFYVAIFVPFLPLVTTSLIYYKKPEKVKKDAKNDKK